MTFSYRSWRLAAVLGLIVGTTTVHAQEAATESAPATEQSREQGSRVERGGRGEGRGGRGGGRGMDRAMGMLPLLRNDSVREELGVKDDQRKTLDTVSAEIRDDVGQQMRDLMGSFRDLSPEERRARRAENEGRFAEIRNNINERLRGSLDENQFRRLKEIDAQRQVRTNGPGALAEGDFAAALDLSDDQKQKLREQGPSDEGQRVSLSLDEVRAKAKDILTPDQNGKLEALFGKAFDLPREMLERGRGRNDGAPRRNLRQRPEFEDAAPATEDAPAQ